MASSRISGFYKLPLEERQRIAAERFDLDGRGDPVPRPGGLERDIADKMIENVVGTYTLPFALGLNVQMNGRDYLVPMVVEEPSVVAAASNAARIIRAGGGFIAESDEPIMIAQVQLDDVPDAQGRLRQRSSSTRTSSSRCADAAVPNLVRAAAEPAASKCATWATA